MKKILMILMLVFVLINSAWAQDNLIKYKPLGGESIAQVAKKFNISLAQIYKLNPDAQSGLKPSMVLLLPNPNSTSTKASTKIAIKSHLVLPKETVYGVAKLYGISVQDLVNFNPAIADEGFRPGQVIKIPNKGAPKPIEFTFNQPTATIDKNKTILHEVLPKETKYAIAKKYDLTIAALEKLNPEIVAGLQIGSKLYISGKRPKPVVAKPIEPTSPVVLENVDPNQEKIAQAVVLPTIIKPNKSFKIDKNNLIDYQIKSKETLYSLSRMFSISQENLVALNPQLATAVQIDMIIQVPNNASIKQVGIRDKSSLLTIKKNNNNKKLALLLPFNITKIQSDTIVGQEKRLLKDGFLNMTLDFYAGALVAIDSARAIGMNVSIKILDSQETKTSSNVENLVTENNLDKYDAVIGPFYKIHSEKIAQLLENNNVPVISPLTKDSGKSFKNLYSSMPSSDYIKDEMFDYMNEKNGNIIAIIDNKKVAIKQYIEQNHKNVTTIVTNSKDVFDKDVLKNALQADKINYVILASEKTGIIIAATNALLAAYKDNDIRLVVLENNPTLDYEEIALSRLTKLKMTYPSLSRDNNSENAKIFENSFRRKNKIFPNQYAVRGFDITFDTLMRLSQNMTFEQTINNNASEQVESRFDYAKKVTGGYVNKGVFVLQYNPDLTISEAP